MALSANSVQTSQLMTTAERDALNRKEKGAIIYNEDTDRLNINIGDDIVQDWEEISLGGDVPPITPQPHADLYFVGNATETTIVSPGTAAKIAGTYLSEITFGFTHLNGTLTCTGPAGDYEIDFRASCTLDGISRDLSVIVYHNGAPVSKSQSGPVKFGPVSPAGHEISCKALINIFPTDTIECYIINNDGSENILVESLYCIAKKLPGGTGVGNPQVVTSWDGSIVTVDVVAGANVDITNGVISTLAPDMRMFSQIQTAGVVNTISELSTIGTIAGTKTIPLNTAIVGESYEIIQTGSITINTGTTPTLTFRVKLNSTIIADIPAVVVPDISGFVLYTLKINSMSFQSIGASGSIVVNGTLELLSVDDELTLVKIGMHNNVNPVIDTTINNVLDITAQWDILGVNNVLISESTTMKRIY